MKKINFETKEESFNLNIRRSETDEKEKIAEIDTKNQKITIYHPELTQKKIAQIFYKQLSKMELHFVNPKENEIATEAIEQFLTDPNYAKNKYLQMLNKHSRKYLIAPFLLFGAFVLAFLISDFIEDLGLSLFAYWLSIAFTLGFLFAYNIFVIFNFKGSASIREEDIFQEKVFKKMKKSQKLYIRNLKLKEDAQDIDMLVLNNMSITAVEIKSCDDEADALNKENLARLKESTKKIADWLQIKHNVQVKVNEPIAIIEKSGFGYQENKGWTVFGNSKEYIASLGEPTQSDKHTFHMIESSTKKIKRKTGILFTLLYNS